jgi:hypothetical protein
MKSALSSVTSKKLLTNQRGQAHLPDYGLITLES